MKNLQEKNTSENLIDEMQKLLYYKNLENKIYIKRNVFYKSFDIQHVIQNLVPEYGIQEVLKYIENLPEDTEENESNSFVIEIPCFECCTPRIVKFDKTKLIAFLLDVLDTTCEDCLRKKYLTKKD